MLVRERAMLLGCKLAFDARLMEKVVIEMINAVIELPDELYHILASHGLSKEIISIESKKLLALKCYKDKILSLGKSAELSGLPMWDFIEFLSKNDVAVIDYDEELLDIELDAVEKLGKAFGN